MNEQVIDQHQHEVARVVMCQVLAVAESGVSAWRKRPASQRQRAEALLAQEIGQVFDKQPPHFMNKPGERSLSALQSTLTASDDCRRLDT